jgi:hypothetical protein
MWDTSYKYLLLAVSTLLKTEHDIVYNTQAQINLWMYDAPWYLEWTHLRDQLGEGEFTPLLTEQWTGGGMDLCKDPAKP